MLNNISFNNVTHIQSYSQVKTPQIQQKVSTVTPVNSELLMKSLNSLASISFGGLQSSLGKTTAIYLKQFEKFIEKDISSNSHYCSFLKTYPRGFYLECGREVNKFLRNGTLKELPFYDETTPANFIPYIQRQIAETKELNRAIIESIDVLDECCRTSKTTESMTVYRDAPWQWMKSAKDGILSDAAYLSTSTERGASMEGLICNGADNFTYEIRLPKGTPFFDLTDTTEKEMLLPRGCKFKIVGDGILELIL